MFMSAANIDIITVADACVRQNIFSSLQEARRVLAEAVDKLPSVSTAPVYAKLVTDNYLLRSLILAGKEIIDAANSSGEPADNVVDFAEHKIYDIRAGVENKSLTKIKGIVYERLRAIDELAKQAQQNGGKPVMTGLETGFTELDKMIFGLNKSDLIILAARPGMGKTSFAMNVAVNVAQKYKTKSVCVFSLEMLKEQIVARMLSSEGMVSSEAMRTGIIPPDAMNRVINAATFLHDLEIYIDDTPAINIMNMKSKLRRMKNLGAVIIDYLQLMRPAGNYNHNRVSEISEITRNLKIMAKELNVPVIALSQLSRSSEQRPDKRPLLSDLRDSGSIEQDADLVLFLYRNSYYDETDPNQNLCECIVAKNRHGEVGTVRLGWQGEYTRFTNVEIQYHNGG